MTSIACNVKGAELDAKVDGILTGGMVGIPVTFAFDAAWDGLNRTAVFRAGKVSRDMVGISTDTVVPWEVMLQENYRLQIGVYGSGEDGGVVIPTVWADAGLIQPGADPSEDPGTDPTQPVWQQLLEKMNSAKICLTDDGNGNVTIGVEYAGAGNVKLEVI